MPARDETSLLVRLLRSIRGVSQEAMGAAASIDRTTVSRYETGDMIPPRVHLARLAGAAGLSLPVAECLLLPVVRLVLEPAAAGLQSVPELAGDIGSALEPRLLATLRSGFATLGVALSAGEAEDDPDLAWAAEDRAAAAGAWVRFASCPAGQGCPLVERHADFQTWAFSERLCDESAAAAGRDPERALALARLGLLAAQRSPGSASWKARLQGYAWAFVGNALRAGGDLPAADAAFSVLGTLWRGRERAAPGVLAIWRVPYLEASLRRDQHSWPRALDLLAKALTMAPAEAAPRILLKQATVLAQSGEVVAALAALADADRRLGAAAQPRLRRLLSYHRIACFCHLRRYAAAAIEVCKANATDSEGEHELDRLRFAWLQARLAAGQGQRLDAAAAFAQLRVAYLERQRPYEAALVSLELALVHLDDGHPGEVRALAESIFCLFGGQRVYREAQTALQLFCATTEVEGPSPAQVQKLRAYLDRVRQDPQLIFGSVRSLFPETSFAV